MEPINIRFSRLYAILAVVLALLFFAVVVSNIVREPHLAVIIVFGLFGIIFLVVSINMPKRTYVSINMKEKVIIVYSIVSFISRKKNFDALFYDGKEFYIEREGKKRLLNILNYACNKSDLEGLIKEFEKG